MCDKCRPHAKYWIHIADSWTQKEKLEMIKYLEQSFISILVLDSEGPLAVSTVKKISSMSPEQAAKMTDNFNKLLECGGK